MSRILTGIQSTGVPHLGNLLGAILPAIQLSNNSDNESFYFIADLHSLTSLKENFNIQLSPLSIKEVESFENQLPNNYLDLLEKKNDSIFNYNESNIDETYDLFYKSITNENKFKSTIRTNNYLN